LEATEDFACPIVKEFIVGFVVIRGLVASGAGVTLKLEEGCEGDSSRFVGFGVCCEGLKKSRIDLFPDMIKFLREQVLNLENHLLSSECVTTS
jgi:hypothetical protein